MIECTAEDGGDDWWELTRSRLERRWLWDRGLGGLFILTGKADGVFYFFLDVCEVFLWDQKLCEKGRIAIPIVDADSERMMACSGTIMNQSHVCAAH